ncbi:MAG: hypothetical protein KGJ60_03680 [Verrucomicrobiota bacterium]|nr:hypothetical protein [Verrucomicrobiota bacterium]
MSTLPLAYKYVAIAVMLAEVNYFASRLHLPIRLPIETSNLTTVTIFDPRFRARLEGRATIYGFGGVVGTRHYLFCFPAGPLSHPSPAKLRFIMRVDTNGFQVYSTTLPDAEFFSRVIGVHSVIDTNGAYQLASNWLEAVGVDVERLQREHPVIVRHLRMVDGSLLPLFHVYWGPKTNTVIDVMLTGANKSLLYLRQNDDSYLGRPFSLIKDADQLLAIPDSEFLKYSPEQRSNLVSRFAAVQYSSIAQPSPRASSRRVRTPTASPEMNWMNWNWNHLSQRKITAKHEN